MKRRVEGSMILNIKLILSFLRICVIIFNIAVIYFLLSFLSVAYLVALDEITDPGNLIGILIMTGLFSYPIVMIYFLIVISKNKTNKIIVCIGHSPYVLLAVIYLFFIITKTPINSFMD